MMSHLQYLNITIRFFALLVHFVSGERWPYGENTCRNDLEVIAKATEVMAACNQGVQGKLN